MNGREAGCMYDLENDGVIILPGFVNQETVDILARELKSQAAKSSSHCRNGAYPRTVSPGRLSYDIPDAANALRSCNLLELAIDVRSCIQISETDLALKSTMISGACDHDPRELKLHSDNLDFNEHSMYRAILYLNDVDTHNGAFRYSRGSHKSDHQQSHYIGNPEDIEDIVECSGDAGTLVLFNAYGIHGRNPCNDPRYSISFEFIPELLAKRNNSISILQGNLSQRVIDNINLFRIEDINPQGKHLFDDLTGKFWCPTTQYDYTSPQFTLSIRAVLRLWINTTLARITPVGLQEKCRYLHRIFK